MLLGMFGGGFRWGKNIIGVQDINKNIPRPFPLGAGAGRDGLKEEHLDDISILGSITRIDATGTYSLLGAFGGGFG